MIDPREQIADEDELYRRIVPTYLRSDGSLSTAAFKLSGKPDPHLSVDLARLTDPNTSLGARRARGFGLIALFAATPRAIGLTVEHDPVEANRAHTLILGASTMEHCDRMARAFRMVIPPMPQT